MRAFPLVLSSALVVVAGCATSPDKMTATDVSPVQYRGYDCDQLAAEGGRIQRKVNALYQQLKNEADRDAWQMGVGLVLFWPTLFFLEGGDGPEAVEYRQLRGEYEAVQRTVTANKCNLQLPDLEAELKARAEKERQEKQKKTSSDNDK